MTPLRRKKTQEAIAAVDAGNYRQAETLLKPLWEEMPGDLEVFRVLQNCYLLQEKWEAAEHQIRTTGETLYGEDIQQDALLHLFLLKKDPGSALKVAAETIVTYPGFLDLYSDIGRQFKAAGYAEPFVAYMLAHLPEGRDKSLFLANHYAIVEQDYRQAMLYLQRILDEAPADAEALSYLDFLQKSEKSSLVAEARTQLSEGNTAEALPL
ncbi:MAG TPA: hypothetical protein PLM41_22645, partial [Saprospiraceae bacterium]|nr:hypothetical protein [Saprospiraceae bacterium]